MFSRMIFIVRSNMCIYVVGIDSKLRFNWSWRELERQLFYSFFEICLLLFWIINHTIWWLIICCFVFTCLFISVFSSRSGIPFFFVGFNRCFVAKIHWKKIGLDITMKLPIIAFITTFPIISDIRLSRPIFHGSLVSLYWI